MASGAGLNDISFIARSVRGAHRTRLDMDQAKAALGLATASAASMLSSVDSSRRKSRRPKPLWPLRLRRLPLLAMGMLCLLCGVWGGLLRLPVALALPVDHANWITFHGPLMVCGFLGTVISLERAVGLRHGWTYAAPVLTGAGGLLIAGGVLGIAPLLLLTAGSGMFVIVAWRVVALQRALFTTLMALAAVMWLAGNLLWCAGWTFPRLVPWWIAFLALTIVGERLDLSRFQKPSRLARPLLLAALALFLGGVALSAFQQAAGERFLGAGLIAIAAWLGRFDLAWRTVRLHGLPRFMAVCLLAGYFWMAVAGLLVVIGAPLQGGLLYDASLHAFFLGFVFSMIFGHAPVIFPAVLQLTPRYHGSFYLHASLLHVALLLRIGGGALGWEEAHRWGGIASALAVGVFLVNTILRFVLPPAQSETAAPRRAPPL